MDKFSIDLQVRWSDIDANRHLRHSVYYDYGAYCRIAFLTRYGLTTDKLASLGLGPILFREEAVFRREIIFEDKIAITAEVVKATEDFSRWSIRHAIIKGDGSTAAILNVDGAWIDLSLRKLAAPDGFVQDVFRQMPRADDFQWVFREKKA